MKYLITIIQTNLLVIIMMMNLWGLSVPSQLTMLPGVANTAQILSAKMNLISVEGILGDLTQIFQDHWHWLIAIKHEDFIPEEAHFEKRDKAQVLFKALKTKALDEENVALYTEVVQFEKFWSEFVFVFLPNYMWNVYIGKGFSKKFPAFWEKYFEKHWPEQKYDESFYKEWTECLSNQVGFVWSTEQWNHTNEHQNWQVLFARYEEAHDQQVLGQRFELYVQHWKVWLSDKNSVLENLDEDAMVKYRKALNAHQALKKSLVLPLAPVSQPVDVAVISRGGGAFGTVSESADADLRKKLDDFLKAKNTQQEGQKEGVAFQLLRGLLKEWSQVTAFFQNHVTDWVNEPVGIHNDVEWRAKVAQKLLLILADEQNFTNVENRSDKSQALIKAMLGWSENAQGDDALWRRASERFQNILAHVPLNSHDVQRKWPAVWGELWSGLQGYDEQINRLVQSFKSFLKDYIFHMSQAEGLDYDMEQIIEESLLEQMRQGSEAIKKIAQQMKGELNENLNNRGQEWLQFQGFLDRLLQQLIVLATLLGGELSPEILPFWTKTLVNIEPSKQVPIYDQAVFEQWTTEWKELWSIIVSEKWVSNRYFLIDVISALRKVTQKYMVFEGREVFRGADEHMARLMKDFNGSLQTWVSQRAKNNVSDSTLVTLAEQVETMRGIAQQMRNQGKSVIANKGEEWMRHYGFLQRLMQNIGEMGDLLSAINICKGPPNRESLLMAGKFIYLINKVSPADSLTIVVKDQDVYIAWTELWSQVWDILLSSDLWNGEAPEFFISMRDTLNSKLVFEEVQSMELLSQMATETGGRHSSPEGSLFPEDRGFVLMPALPQTKIYSEGTVVWEETLKNWDITDFVGHVRVNHKQSSLVQSIPANTYKQTIDTILVHPSAFQLPGALMHFLMRNEMHHLMIAGDTELQEFYAQEPPFILGTDNLLYTIATTPREVWAEVLKAMKDYADKLEQAGVENVNRYRILLTALDAMTSPKLYESLLKTEGKEINYWILQQSDLLDKFDDWFKVSYGTLRGGMRDKNAFREAHPAQVEVASERDDDALRKRLNDFLTAGAGVTPQQGQREGGVFQLLRSLLKDWDQVTALFQNHVTDWTNEDVRTHKDVEWRAKVARKLLQVLADEKNSPNVEERSDKSQALIKAMLGWSEDVQGDDASWRRASEGFQTILARFPLNSPTAQEQWKVVWGEIWSELQSYDEQINRLGQSFKGYEAHPAQAGVSFEDPAAVAQPVAVMSGGDGDTSASDDDALRKRLNDFLTAGVIPQQGQREGGVFQLLRSLLKDWDQVTALFQNHVTDWTNEDVRTHKDVEWRAKVARKLLQVLADEQNFTNVENRSDKSQALIKAMLGWSEDVQGDDASWRRASEGFQTILARFPLNSPTAQKKWKVVWGELWSGLQGYDEQINRLVQNFKGVLKNYIFEVSQNPALDYEEKDVKEASLLDQIRQCSEAIKKIAQKMRGEVNENLKNRGQEWLQYQKFLNQLTQELILLGSLLRGGLSQDILPSLLDALCRIVPREARVLPVYDQDVFEKWTTEWEELWEIIVSNEALLSSCVLQPNEFRKALQETMAFKGHKVLPNTNEKIVRLMEEFKGSLQMWIFQRASNNISDATVTLGQQVEAMHQQVESMHQLFQEMKEHVEFDIRFQGQEWLTYYSFLNGLVQNIGVLGDTLSDISVGHELNEVGPMVVRFSTMVKSYFPGYAAGIVIWDHSIYNVWTELWDQVLDIFVNKDLWGVRGEVSELGLLAIESMRNSMRTLLAFKEIVSMAPWDMLQKDSAMGGRENSGFMLMPVLPRTEVYSGGTSVSQRTLEDWGMTDFVGHVRVNPKQSSLAQNTPANIYGKTINEITVHPSVFQLPGALMRFMMRNEMWQLMIAGDTKLQTFYAQQSPIVLEMHSLLYAIATTPREEWAKALNAMKAYADKLEQEGVKKVNEYRTLIAFLDTVTLPEIYDSLLQTEGEDIDFWAETQRDLLESFSDSLEVLYRA